MTDKTLKILLVEDNPGDARLILEMLKSIPGNKISGFGSLSAAFEYLEQHSPDIILLDLGLPDSQGLDTVRRVASKMPALPIIVLTGLGDDMLALDAIKIGAQDYMEKGLVEPEILMRAIRYAMERKLVEEELNKHREHLEDLVRERTQELKERNVQLEKEISERLQTEEQNKSLENQLIQAQKMEAIGRFAGGIAHDLNNILYPIIINTEILLEDAQPSSLLHETLKQILEGANRQKDLVRHILSFSRQNGQNYIPIRVIPLVKECLNFIRSAIPSTIDIRQHIDASLDTIMGDSTQIYQVIMNLCKNASDAIGQQSGAIEVTLENTLLERIPAHYEINPGRYLKLTVRDTGCGMTSELMNHIFEPFYSTKEMGKGSGMGLAVVHGILKNHGGTVTVESEIGKGSRFTIYLPLTKKKSRRKGQPQDDDYSNTLKVKILLVDDEESILTSLKNALNRLNYDVVPVKDSQEALNMFSSTPDEFDLVITDLTMPRLSGIELSSKLLEIRSDIPIILCTGFNDAIDEEEAKASGIRELILKPASISELRKTIQLALEN
jgi:signal transduction histidine kinase